MMVTLSEARQSIDAVKAQVNVEKQNNETARQQLLQAQNQVNTQRAMRVQDLNAFRKRQDVINRIGESSQALTNREQYITDYENNTIAPAEKQLADAEALQVEYERQTAAYNKAQAALGSKSPGAVLAGDELAWEYYSGLRDNVTNEELFKSINAAIPKIAEKGITDPQQIKEELQNNFGIISTEQLNNKISDIITNSPFRAVEIPKVDKPITFTFTPSPTTSGDMFPLASAASPQSIKVINESAGDGQLSSGLSNRTYNFSNVLVDSKAQPRTGISGFVSGLFSGIAENKKEETYVPELGGFASASQGLGLSGSGTSTFRPPTLQEKQNFDNLKIKYDFFSQNPNSIIDTSRQFNQLTTGLSDLKGDELNKRLSELQGIGANVVGRTTKEGITYDVTAPTVGIGYGLNKRQVPVNELGDSKVGIYGNVIRRYARDSASSLIPAEGFFPGSVKTITSTGRKETLQYDNKGNPIPTLFTTESALITPGAVGTAAEIATNAIYLVPVIGAGLFFGEQALKIGESVVSKKGLVSGLTSYVADNPVETAGNLFFGGKALANFAKKPIVKYNLPGVSRQTVTAPNGMQFIIETYPSVSKATSKDLIVPFINPATKELNAAGKFKLKVEQPVETATAQSRISSIFFSPKEYIVRNPRTDLAAPAGLVVTNEAGEIINPVLVGTKREGGNLIKISRYQGQQVPLDIESFSSLPMTKKIELQAMAEAKAGIPVNLENTPGVLGKDLNKFLYSQGGLITTRLGRGDLKTESLYQYDYGSRVVRSELVSQAKPISEIKYLEGGTIITSKLPEDLPYTLYDTTTAIKSSVKTSQIKSGKIDLITGKSIVLKEPINPGAGETSNVIITSGGKSEKIDLGLEQVNKVNTALVSAKNQKVLEAVKVDVLKDIPKNKITKAGEALKSLESEKPINIAPNMKGVAVAESLYAGTGQYERTESTLSLLPAQSEKSLLDIKNVEVLKNNIRQVPSEGLKLNDIQTTKSVPREVETLKNVQLLKPAQAQKLNLEQKQALKNVQSQVNKNRPVRTKITRLKFGSDNKKSNSNLLSAVSKLSKGFKTFIYRKGQKQYLPGITTKGEALRRGVSRVTSDLSATFGVEETNQFAYGLDNNYAPSPLAFRNYKIRGGKKILLKDTFIQKAGTKIEGLTVKGGRLSSRSEVAELLSSRKRKSRSKKRIYGL